MAETLENRSGPEVPATISSMLESVQPGFPRDVFLAEVLEGFEAMELTQRARHVARVLRAYLPDDPTLALGLIVDSLGPEIGDSELTGMEVFVDLPFVFVDLPSSASIASRTRCGPNTS